jgi:DNA (cytosine-5)-methyltransferase 1
VVFETVCTDLESEGYEVQAFNIPAAGVGAPHRRERIWILATLGNSELNGSSTTKITRSITETSNDNEERENATREFKGASGSRDSKIMANSNTRFGNGTNEEIFSRRQTSNTSSTGGGDKDVENSRRALQQGTVFQGENENEIRKGNADQSQRSSSSSEYDVANPSSKQSHSNDNRQEQREISQQEQIELGGGSGGTLWPSNWEFEPNVGRVANGIPGRVHRLKGLGNSIVPKIAEEIGKAIVASL